MRFSTSVFLAGLFAAASSAAMAEVQTGNEVSVNPIPAGGGVLLYPGGQYMRVVHPLLQPGEKPGPVQLHMPTKRSVPRASAIAASPPVRHAPAVQAAIAPPPVRHAPVAPKRVAAAPAPAAPAPSGGYNAGYGVFGAPQGAAGLDLAPPAPRQVAKAEPPPTVANAQPAGPGLTKRSVILFAAGAADPAESALGAIKFLAGDLNTAMTSASSRVQILAYGGDKGDKGSDARRLSLKRALAIRQVLIDDGVDSRRIDVRAMGGADDGGPTDRVDVYVKT
jgi:outer membrane protein OmpA-like peptidoglycan-associated protein